MQTKAVCIYGNVCWRTTKFMTPLSIEIHFFDAIFWHLVQRMCCGPAFLCVPQFHQPCDVKPIIVNAVLKVPIPKHNIMMLSLELSQQKMRAAKSCVVIPLNLWIVCLCFSKLALFKKPWYLPSLSFITIASIVTLFLCVLSNI